MKQNVHPKWNHQAKVVCACGATFLTGSMGDTIEIDICSQCHPFFTGEMKFVDIQGRVEKFKARQQAAQTKGVKKNKKKQQDDNTQSQPVQSLKELLQEEKGRLTTSE